MVAQNIQIKIGSTWVTKSININSLYIENILTRQVDRARFTIVKYGDVHTFTPIAGQDVQIFNDGTKIFGGIIIKITQGASDYKVIEYEVECEDYARLLDRKLVADTFSNQTIGSIIQSIATNYLSSDFDINNVVGVDKIISYIAFNYIPVSQCLQQLADLINYDWYVDYDKSIHFFAKDYNASPFDLNDDDGSFIFSSLKIRRDNSQVKNVIYVRGGEYLASTFTTEYLSNGSQNVYPLPYRYETLQTNVTGSIWDQGIDGLDPITAKDYIWNQQEKFIRFRGDRIPNNTSTIRISGQPYLPVRVVVRDDASIASMVSSEGGDGEYEYVIIDNSIDSREGARERASAELESYKETLSEAEFRTYNDNLKAGQRIRVNSSAHGIDEYFIINKVSCRMWTNEALVYDVSLVTTKTMGIIEFLQGLLMKEKKQIIIDENEVVDLIYAKSENVTITESVTSSKDFNEVTESITISENVTEQALNYPVEFCVGPITPTGYKRQFILNQSPLG